MTRRREHRGNKPRAGGVVAPVALFTPFTQRSVTLRNRIVMSPMCQYSRRRGAARTTGTSSTSAAGRSAAPALVFVEATAVTPRRPDLARRHWGSGATPTSSRWPGSPGSSRRRARSPGIQLAHAGRKASCDAPWKGGAARDRRRAAAGSRRRRQPDPVQRGRARPRARSTRPGSTRSSPPSRPPPGARSRPGSG